MGQYLTSEAMRTQFAVPLRELARDFEHLCNRWKMADESGEIARPDILLNQASSEAAIHTLRKFLRETSGKLDDAIAGVYRYRDTERRRRKRLVDRE